MNNLTKEDLYKFESKTVDHYKAGDLRSPIHLSGSVDGRLEDFLIDFFKKVKKEDWIFTTYRSHYHSLLKGVPEDVLMEWILDNKSIHVMNSEHKVISSAIVGGTLPIALGVAQSIKIKKGSEKVYIFCGDMTASLGVFHDVWSYSMYNDLPIHFIIEDNGLSTDTNTRETWGSDNMWYDGKGESEKITYFKYTREYPHYGCGVFVDFKDDGLKQDGSNF